MAQNTARSIVCLENVRRYYGDKPDLVAKYQHIVEGGQCPFCAPNIENESIGETAHWNIVKNQYPYVKTRCHLLVLPKRHVTTLSGLCWQEWADLANALAVAVEKYPFLKDGYGMAVRVGEVGGITLTHLHWHIIAPEIGADGQIPTYFGIG